MNNIGFLLVIAFFTLTGWLIPQMILKFLFWPLQPLNFAGLKIQGLLPTMKERLAASTGKLIQAEFMQYEGLEETVADPALFAKLRPDIESHVDHFLHVKLKTVFPLLSQFMGEKTLSQFKSAFLGEIEILFPTMMANYVDELKKEIKLDQLVRERVAGIEIASLKKGLFENARKEINYFTLACTAFAFAMGVICVCVLLLVQP